MDAMAGFVMAALLVAGAAVAEPHIPGGHHHHGHHGGGHGSMHHFMGPMEGHHEAVMMHHGNHAAAPLQQQQQHHSHHSHQQPQQHHQPHQQQHRQQQQQRQPKSGNVSQGGQDDATRVFRFSPHHVAMSQGNRVVHHVSHGLPGKSSVSISRYYVAPPLASGFYFQPLQQRQRPRRPSHIPITNQNFSQAARQNDQQKQRLRQRQRQQKQQQRHRLLQQQQQRPRQGHSLRPLASAPQPAVSHLHPSHNQNDVTQHQKHNPFNPRFEVGREEVSDEEWRREIEEAFAESGLIPAVLEVAPPGLVNINFGTHNCVHMGTELDSETSAYEPSAVSWPVEDDDALYTLVAFDPDDAVLHWMVVNVPGTDVDRGQTIAEYRSPAPTAGTGPHRYVFVAMEQEGGQRLDPARQLAHLVSKGCDARSADFSLASLRAGLSLGPPAAANYFVVSHDDFADSIVEYCDGRRRHQ